MNNFLNEHGRKISGGYKAGRSLEARLESLKEGIDGDKLRIFIATEILKTAPNIRRRRPPIKTGRLKQSGSVFVGSKLIGTTNRGKGTPITNYRGKEKRIYVMYDTPIVTKTGKHFNYAYYQNYNDAIGVPEKHHWVEELLSERRREGYVKRAMGAMLNERY